jgi:predicted nucleotidyltransferase
MSTRSHPEIEAILVALRRELDRVLGDQMDSLVLFGSRARGDAGPYSDIDVLVVMRGTFDYADLVRRTSAVVADLSLRHDVVISRSFVSRERFEHEHSPFLLNVHREGVAI